MCWQSLPELAGRVHPRRAPPPVFLGGGQQASPKMPVRAMGALFRNICRPQYLGVLMGYICSNLRGETQNHMPLKTGGDKNGEQRAATGTACAPCNIRQERTHFSSIKCSDIILCYKTVSTVVLMSLDTSFPCHQELFSVPTQAWHKISKAFHRSFLTSSSWNSGKMSPVMQALCKRPRKIQTGLLCFSQVNEYTCSAQRWSVRSFFFFNECLLLGQATSLSLPP